MSFVAMKKEIRDNLLRMVSKKIMIALKVQVL